MNGLLLQIKKKGWTDNKRTKENLKPQMNVEGNGSMWNGARKRMFSQKKDRWILNAEF